MKYEAPVRCTTGDRKILFYILVDEEHGTISIIYKYKAGGKTISSVSLAEAVIQLLKSRVYIRD